MKTTDGILFAATIRAHCARVSVTINTGDTVRVFAGQMMPILCVLHIDRRTGDAVRGHVFSLH